MSSRLRSPSANWVVSEFLNMSHLFGPVPSRRLGLSLGVDLIAPKTCTFDCLYCEVGRTTHLTRKRRHYRVAEIIRELEDYLADPPAPLDYVTMAGSGEPTLNLGLGDIIAAVKNLTTTPVAVLTNGSLCYLPEVRAEMAACRRHPAVPRCRAGRDLPAHQPAPPGPVPGAGGFGPQGPAPGICRSDVARNHGAQGLERF
jgi:hypothetical protein